MNYDHIIAHHQAGGKLECRSSDPRFPEAEWVPSDHRVLDFLNWDYRVSKYRTPPIQSADGTLWIGSGLKLFN